MTLYGRFCEACGLSVGSTRIPARKPVREAVELQRVCGTCGVPAKSEDSERCINCGGRIVTLGGDLD